MALVILTNVALPASATMGQTSNVDEPSLAKNGSQIYYSGNWFAARSLDDAATWSYINPFNTFPASDGGFCCDQTLIYDPSRDLTIWLLQYIKSNNTNTLRIAVKKGTGGAVYTHYYDLRPGNVDPNWSQLWFDYNSAALSDNYLYVTTNAFTGATNQFARAVVFRIPLNTLASGAALTYDYFSTTGNGSLRCTQGATNTMYIGSQQSLSSIRVFSWPESSTSVTSTVVAVNAWASGAYSAPGPDGNNWLSRTDGRITGAFLANGVIGFLWTSNSTAGRPFPYVRVVRLNATTNAVIDQPDIWNSTYAFAYPDATPNDTGDVGLTVFRGGGPIFPTHAVGVWDNASNTWQIADTQAGTNGPANLKWGDYLTCRKSAPDGVTFVASGYTLQGGSTQASIQPRYVRFASASIVSIGSHQFANVFLRMDGRGVTGFSGPGGGIVNCQFGVGPWERFFLLTHADGSVAIGSVQFPGVFLRMDGRNVTQFVGPGGGVVNCQFGVGPWEKYKLETQSDGTIAIASVQFPGVYLRMDGRGVTGFSGPGGGIVNCQYGVGAWEKYDIAPA